MDEQTHRLFHTLWTADVGTPGYDKQRWLEMEAYLNRGVVDKWIKSPDSHSGDARVQIPPTLPKQRFYDSE